MSDLIPQPTEVVNPATGEAIELATATTDVLASPAQRLSRSCAKALNAYRRVPRRGA
jgi:hypothetical protein